MTNYDRPIQVLNEQTDLRSALNGIISSGHEEDPFYFLDINDIMQKYKMWKIAMPRVKPHYAVKCNDHPIVLKVMAAMGLGFDCASKGEIDKVLSLEVDPSRIIYAHTTKLPSHILHAAKLNVNLMTFDNELELQKIKKLHPAARTVIRIKYDSNDAYCLLGLKFGCDSRTEAPHLLKVAHRMGINVVGVSFHVGSGCNDIQAFYGAISSARHVFDIASTLGYDFNFLDIGGGYPGEMDDSINEYGKIINQALEDFFPDNSIRVISEPGTYFVSSAFTLVSNVHSAKKIISEDPITKRKSTRFMYYINDGVFGSLNCVISYHIFKIPQPLKKYPPNSKKYSSIVWGPTCDSMDKVIADILLPELDLGDWLYFTDMGAYTLSLWTTFNGFECPTVYSIINQNNWSLLRNKAPFIKEDFLNKSNERMKTNVEADQKEIHYVFPEKSFVKG